MKHTYHITGMTCNGCRTHVQEALEKVEGVTSAEVDLESGKANVESDHHIAVDVLKEAVAASGNYALHEDEHAHHPHPPKKKDTGPGIYYCPMRCEGDKTYDHPGNCPVCGMDLVKEAMSGEDLDNATFNDLRKKLLISLIFTIPVFIIAMSDMIPGKPLLKLFSHNIWNWIQLVLSVPVVFYTCWMFFQRAWSSIVRRSPNMFTLIGIGSGVAWLFSLVALIFPDIFPDQFKTADGHVHLYFESAVVILTLVLLGQMLEAGAHNRTNTALKALLNLAPNQATRVLEGKDKVVSIDDIKVGDIIKVKAGEKVPVDGIIVEGSASLDESMITGEPIPVDLEVNDQVRSGSINGNTTFLFKAEKVGAETLLSQIIDMVKNASRSRAPVQDLADKISTYFVPIIVGISVLTFTV
ncbi:MAG: HAD-IC family P-type ATPase [Crocinitomicaceae bacterium]